MIEKKDEIVGNLCDDWKRLHFSQMTSESSFVEYICIRHVGIHIIVILLKKTTDKSHIRSMTNFYFGAIVNLIKKSGLTLLNFKFFRDVNRDASADAFACNDIKTSVVFTHDPTGNCQSQTCASGTAGA